MLDDIQNTHRGLPNFDMNSTVQIFCKDKVEGLTRKSGAQSNGVSVMGAWINSGDSRISSQRPWWSKPSEMGYSREEDCKYGAAYKRIEGGAKCIIKSLSAVFI